jgi:hypothetical protein
MSQSTRVACRGEQGGDSLGGQGFVDSAVRMAACVGGCLVLIGCSSGEYNRRLEETIQRIETEVRLHGAASPIVDSSTGATIRLPEMIGADAQTLQQGDEAQPSFLALPGFAYAYKFQAEGQPGYLYVATVPVADKPPEELTRELQTEVRKTFSSAAWQDVTVTPPGGTPLAVKRLTAEGTQKFGQQDLPGRLDLYLASTPTHHVLLGWRAPSGTPKFFEAAAASVGTLTGVGS